MTSDSLLVQLQPKWLDLFDPRQESDPAEREMRWQLREVVELASLPFDVSVFFEGGRLLTWP